jgi:hypothetical protein
MDGQNKRVSDAVISQNKSLEMAYGCAKGALSQSLLFLLNSMEITS